VASETKLYIGLDVGRTIRGALIQGDGIIVRQRQVVSEVREPPVFIRQLADMIDALRATDEAGGDQVMAVGIGWAGLVNQRENRLEVAPNILDLSAFDVHRELCAATGLPIVFDNDANAGCYGEWRCGAARGYHDVFYITIGTGIGAALILGEKLHRGSLGFAGEFGHCKIVPIGAECGCGSTGCLETVASGPNIVRRVREQLFSDPSFSISPLARDMEGAITCSRIFQAAREQDELAGLVLRETGVYLGTAVASVINLLNVEMIVMGGGVMTDGEVMLALVREEAQKRALPPAYACCRIVAAELGQDAGIIGAAMLARDTISNAG
jgi:glucokinase